MPSTDYESIFAKKGVAHYLAYPSLPVEDTTKLKRRPNFSDGEL